ncbi:MAG: hypothetical protein Q9195_003909 [Heterodermia aff. obscurata]
MPMLPEDVASRPLEIKRVSPAIIKQIFGLKVDQERGNFILRKLQGQRVAGVLDEGIPNVDESTLYEGLEWLRTNYPLDEDAAIISRLEREEAQESQALIDRAVKLRIYAPRDAEEQTTSEVETSPPKPVGYVPQQDPERNRVLGHSYLEEKHKENEAANKAEEAAEKAKQEAAEAEAIRTGVPIVTTETKALARREKLAEKKAMWLEYAQKTYGDKGEPWPKMTALQRLWPSAVFTAITVGLSVLFAIYYTPPPKKARIWPDVPPAAATVLVLIGMNVLVYLAWHVLVLQRGLFRYFLNVPGYPSSFAIIGNTFSHQTFSHLATNMLVLWLFGTRLHDDIGRGPFVATYIACGALSSFGSLTAHVFTSAFQSGALGASGALMGIMAAWCVVNVNTTISVWFLPDEWTKHISTLAFLALLIGGDIFFMRKGTMGNPYKNVDYSSHVFGYFTGIGAGVFINKRLDLRQSKLASTDNKKETIQPVG